MNDFHTTEAKAEELGIDINLLRAGALHGASNLLRTNILLPAGAAPEGLPEGRQEVLDFLTDLPAQDPEVEALVIEVLTELVEFLHDNIDELVTMSALSKLLAGLGVDTSIVPDAVQAVGYDYALEAD